VKRFKKNKTSGFLVIEVLPSCYQISLLYHYPKKNELEVNKTWSFDNLEELRKKLRSFSNTNHSIILSLSPDLAQTTYSYHQFTRRDPHQSIDETELEGFISQLVWRFVNQGSSYGLTLSQFHIRHFTIDGHKVTEPIGLTGKEVKIHFSKTLAQTNFLNDLKSILPADKVVIVSEAGALWTNVITRSLVGDKSSHPKKIEPFICMPVFYDSAPVYSFNDETVAPIKVVSWGEKNLLSVLFGNLAVNQATARKILQQYCEQNISTSLAKKFATFWQHDFKSLSQQLEKIMIKEKATQLYLLAFSALPFNHIKLKRSFNYQVVDNSFISQKLGYKLKFHKEAKMANDFSAVASLAEFLSLSIDNLPNKIANRRLRWYEKGS
jgi:hypothetical protein